MKQKSISPITLGMSDSTKKAIECIINQLEENGFAIITDGIASREFTKNLPLFYRRHNIILVSRTKQLKNNKCKTVITIKPEYQFIRQDSYSFKLEMKI